jgi:hypothetical protein
MSGRRGHDRFELASPWIGSVRILRDVPIRLAPGGRLTVFSRTAALAGEVMRVDLSGGGRTQTIRVEVAGSRPVADDGTVRHALELRVLETEIMPGVKGIPRGSMRAMVGTPDLVSVLVRDVPARMRNFSGSGCLVESPSPIDEGTVAELRMRIGEADYSDPVRVVRCRRLEGAGSTYYVGVEFAWTTRPGARSLRLKVRLPPACVPAMGGSRLLQASAR